MAKTNWTVEEAKDYLNKGVNKERFISHVNLVFPLFRINKKYFFNLMYPSEYSGLDDERSYGEGWYPCDMNNKELVDEGVPRILLILKGIFYTKNNIVEIKDVALSKWVGSPGKKEDGVLYDQKKEGEKLFVIKGFIYENNKTFEVNDVIFEEWKSFNSGLSSTQ